jgi:drug/metabolite transporter (DMT)-like permease
VLLAALLLKERLNRIQMLGIALSLAAIYLFNVPSDVGPASSWLAYALVPIALWGLCGLMQKVSTNDISARSSAIWFLAAFIPVAAVLLVYDPLPRDMTWKTWAAATALGFTMAAGNFTILLAFASGGKASIIAPLAGLYPIVSLPICIAVLGESIRWREGLGIALAMAAVVMLSYQSPPEAAGDPILDTEILHEVD